MSSRKTYRLVARVMNERINQLREHPTMNARERQDRLSEHTVMMDRFVNFFQVDNEHFNRQIFEKAVQRFPEQ